MKIQRRSWDCGPICIINALKAIGVNVTEKQVHAYSGTTKKDGTNQFGILSALAGLNVPAKEYFLDPEEENNRIFNDFLQENLMAGHPIIIDFYNGAHWVALVGTIGDRVIVWDSDFSKKNKKENGSYALTEEQLFKRWKPDTKGLYYLILVNYDDKT